MPTVPSIRSLDYIFAAFATTTVLCACLHALLKNTYRLECINASAGSSANDSVLRSTAIACVLAAALSLVTNAVSVLKSGFTDAWAAAASICSKWQPLYFVVVSAQKVILRAIVVSKDKEFCSYVELQVEALLWDCTIFLAGLSIIASDSAKDWTPVKRRCSYFALAVCLLVDAIGSFLWGNVIQTSQKLSVGDFNFLLDNQIASSVTSQVVIAIHLLFVSCRSRSGRGWAYASLRFELDESVRVSMPTMILPDIKSIAHGKSATASSASALTPMLMSEGDGQVTQIDVAAASGAFSRIRHRIAQFQKRKLLQCRAFVIPCTVIDDVESGECAGIKLTRPAFDVRCLRSLQRLADAHLKLYYGFGFFAFAIPSIVCTVLLTYQKSLNQILGSCCVVLNSFMFITIIGHISSTRCGLDRVAVKHVMASFRFLTCVALLAGSIALKSLDYFLSPSFERSIVNLSAFVIVCFLFLACLLLDCSPNLPASIQIFISLTACAAFGFWMIEPLQRASTGNRDNMQCHFSLGAFEVCSVTQRLSIHTSLFLLMAQALVSRILVPGMSNFVNASVRRPVLLQPTLRASVLVNF
jgi:hypothetical protein